MYRREMLKRILAAMGGTLLSKQLNFSRFGYGAPLGINDNTEQPLQCGWVNDLAARKSFIAANRRPFLSQQNSAIRGTGKGKIVLLYKFFEEVTGSPLISHSQEIGDCVGHAFGLGIDVLTAVQIAMRKQPERWVAKCATEIIYAGSRIEVGKNKVRGDGSMGVWASEFVKEWGVLLRQPYLNGKYDYTQYSGSVARILGKNGVPNDLESLCRMHPVKTCSIVRSWKECRDAVANGYPVAMCSNTGFYTRRNRDGFIRRSRRPWNHAMIILGIDDNHRRPGALIQNSWGGTWARGSIRHGQPKGSFWADASAIDYAMKQGDSIALSGYVGYPRVKIPDYQIW